MSIEKKNVQRKLLVCGSLTVFFLLLVSLNRIRLIFTFAFFVLSLGIVLKESALKQRFEKRLILPQLAIVLFVAVRFYEYWMSSSRVNGLAVRLSLTSEQFLVLIAGLAAIVSFYGLNLFLCAVMRSDFALFLHRYMMNYPVVNNGLLLFLIVLLQFVQLQRSALDYFPNIFNIRLPYLAVNLLALAVLDGLMMLLFFKEKTGVVFTSSLLTLFSIANYYVTLFHGSPLFPTEFANTRTAFHVLSGYSFNVSAQIIDVIALFMADLSISRFFRVLNRTRKTMILQSTSLVVSAVILYFALFSQVALKERWQFSWNASVMYGGFVPSAAADLKHTLHPVRTPDNYNASSIAFSEPDNKQITDEYPDIILILNESFCDLSYFCSIDTDIDYLGDYYHIENASYGIAFSPDIGGGTNDSEFELLTSDSMYLLAASAPFNYISFSDRNSTLVSYLKSLGYSTTAMHNSTPYNYSRHIVYPAMGFDSVFLGEDSFSKTNFYGNRPVFDSDDYQGMISLYKSESVGPRFYYLLTYQNHGGWEQNDASLDLVHTRNDFGSLSDDVDEYLTSIKLSADAFCRLTEYFEKSDRRVIVCMVGDHAPSLIHQLEAGRPMTLEETELWKRAVPYVIWANFEYDRQAGTTLASMTDLVPMMLSNCHMPLTPFYEQILKIRETVPVRTRFGICMDSDGELFKYSNTSQYYEILEQYFFMEYNGLTAKDDYLPDLFRVP